MRVIGTAGHVDHGKSTLVQALTGTHPDRLKEEREREMTIDLGFAFFNLPGGEEVGIVDVPGHRDFIENMLAGVGGIDAVLFVIAADEGVMPQTREHLAILDLLQVQGGVVALTKMDLVDDPAWLDLIEEECSVVFRGTPLEHAPVIRVSARRGQGILDLALALESLLAGRAPRPDYGRPRLPVDRVFWKAGFGTIVTGTLADGSLSIGAEVEIAPLGLRGRVRGLQHHNRKAEVIEPGTRTAVNISGISHEQIGRGSWVILPGSYPATQRLDVQFSMLSGAALPLKHDAEVKLFLGAAEVLGRVRVLGEEAVRPGSTGWLQIELAKPVIARRGDRFILRRPSPGETIGGGGVVDPLPSRRHRRFSTVNLERLSALAKGSPEDIYLEAALAAGPAAIREISRTSGLESEVVDGLLVRLVGTGNIILLEDGPVSAQAGTMIAHRAVWERVRASLIGEIEQFHRRLPLRSGMAREELRSKLSLPAVVFNLAMRALAVEGDLVEIAALVHRAGHTIRFSQAQQERAAGLLRRFAENPYNPPSVKEAVVIAGEEIYAAMIDLGQLLQVSPEVVFRTEDYLLMKDAVVAMISASGTVTVAGFRDRFNSSRKFALAFLEHLDSLGLTVREGEGRKLK